jgi:1-acyl-sn-glycerol-3-phosphate acyltransferase
MPRYALSPIAPLVLSLSIFFGWPRRSLALDSTRLLNMHVPRPVITGQQHFPTEGAFILVANHYQRPGLWIGWVGALLAEAVCRQRGGDPPLRIVVTATQQVKLAGRALTIPLSGWFLSRVAEFWGMIRMPSAVSQVNQRAAALRRVIGALKNGEPVLVFPEGEEGSAHGLTQALPGTGAFLAMVSRYAPLIPVGFWEDGAVLRGCVGPPFELSSRDDGENRREVMRQIAALIPS